MANYYFVTTMLPSLRIGSPPEIESRELDFMLKLNLSHADLAKVTILRRLVDIENIRRLWQREPLDPGGNFDATELEEHLVLYEVFPPYVSSFMEKYTTTQKRLDHFPMLLHAFFQHECAKASGFIKTYLTFEREWRLVLVTLRAKYLQRDPVQALSYEDPDDPFIQQILDQKDAKEFEPPTFYKPLQLLYNTKMNEPLELYQGIQEWRFEYIGDMVDGHMFNVDRILGYVLRLDICEKWLLLDKKKGFALVEHL